MKNLCIIIIVFAGLHLNAQTYMFGYDGAGNRTSRVISLKSAMADTSYVEDTLPTPVNSGADVSQKNKSSKYESFGDVSLEIYPNPTVGELVLKLNNYEELPQGQIQVYDLEGNVIVSQTKLRSVNHINLSKAANGTYILNAIINNEVSKWKIIKE